jgi:hypothetical protein
MRKLRACLKIEIKGGKLCYFCREEANTPPPEYDFFLLFLAIEISAATMRSYEHFCQKMQKCIESLLSEGEKSVEPFLLKGEKMAWKHFC